MSETWVVSFAMHHHPISETTKETKNSLWWFGYKLLKLGGMLTSMVTCFLVVKIETSKLQHYIVYTLSELII
jgi:hypothetical protein